MRHDLAALLFDLGDTILMEETEIKDLTGTTLRADLFPGMDAALRELKEQGYRLALVADTRSGTAANILRQHSLSDLFHATAISEEVGVEKPDPRIFRAALDALGIAEPEYGRVLMVGNNLERDIAGANRLGLISVLFHANERRRSHPLTTDEKPQHTVTSAAELLALVDRLEREAYGAESA